jgi:hypothetical protein
MQADLAFFTTSELIDELMSRHTFMCVVVQSEQEHRTRAWQGEKQFKVHFNDNLSPPEAARLLGTVSEYMDQHC